jgi:hypothetical protein
MRCSAKRCTADPGSSQTPSLSRSRVCSAPLRSASCCAAPGKRRNSLRAPGRTAAERHRPRDAAGIRGLQQGARQGHGLSAFGAIAEQAGGGVRLFRPDLRFRKERGKQNADRRVVQPPHPTGRGARPAGRARLSAFHHGACGSDRTPPLSFSHALPATGLRRSGRYPLPAVMQCSELLADRSSCRPGVLAKAAWERS